MAHALIVSPHPDDETLATGGLIASLRGRGVPVTVIAVTDGEHAYQDMPELAAIRREEQRCAVARLGVEASRLVRLGLPDSDVAGMEETLAARLMESVTPHTHVFAPWTGDFHPDHEACGRAAQVAATVRGARLSFYFFWTWHRGNLDTVRGLPLRVYPLGEDLRQAKLEALACHRSQLVRECGDPVLPDWLLGPARWPYEVLLDAEAEP